MSKPKVSRKFVGVLFIFLGVLNVLANFWWLSTGDIDRPQLHIVMKGGEYGFWVSTIVFALLFIFGIYLLCTRESK